MPEEEWIRRGMEPLGKAEQLLCGGGIWAESRRMGSIL